MPKKLTNKELTEAIIKESSEVVRTGLKNVDKGDGQAVYEVLSNFEEVRNGFINTLVNRCVKTKFFSKVYDNPLKMLHNGVIPFGDSIQEIFVRLGERKGFNEHFETSGGTAENDLIGKRVPQIDVDYISQNFAHKYKVTISEDQLKTAFLNEGGLGSLISQLSSNNLSTAEKDEYEDMKGLLTRPSEENKNGHTFPKGVIYQIAENTQIRDTAIVSCGTDIRNLCKNIRAYSKKMGFISNKYNISGVPTWSSKEELIFFTTPEVSAEIDVNVLAQAFNVGMADIQFRTIIVDELPKNLMVNSQSKGDVLGVLADKNLIQAWDIINTSRHFENGNALYTNYFLHKQGIMNLCKFAQCIVFTNK